MIRYNWSAIKKYTELDLKKIILYFDTIYFKKTDIAIFLANNPYAKKIVNESKDRKDNMSFMENYTDFRNNSMMGTEQEMLVYLDLISKRDMFTYLNTKKKVNYIPIWNIIDEYDIEKLKTNRLLFINERNIYFIYEGDY